jgi:phenylpyruvate tautomerase PptA (4-oxalocrotonate tautomerase family)
MPMQQLSFLDAPLPENVVPVWNTLDEEQRAALVNRLARLIAKTLETATSESRDE